MKAWEAWALLGAAMLPLGGALAFFGILPPWDALAYAVVLGLLCGAIAIACERD